MARVLETLRKLLKNSIELKTSTGTCIVNIWDCEKAMENSMKKMLALFVGHGSPMNAIEDNKYTRNWAKIASEIPKPEAILAVSAHWHTTGSRITDEATKQ